jgi:hypothetical protein
VWEYLNTHHKDQAVAAEMQLLFRRLGEEDLAGAWATTAKEGSIDMNVDGDGRQGFNVRSERLAIAMGTIKPEPMEIYSWTVDYRQDGIW